SLRPTSNRVHIQRLSNRSIMQPDRGFTLIELLVVIIIIGILAAIAVPVFLNQRNKGYDAQAKSDLRNLAGFEEVYLNDTDSYGTIAQVRAIEPTLNPSHGVTLSVARHNGGPGYCLSAHGTGPPETGHHD